MRYLIILIVLKVHDCTKPINPAIVGGQETKAGEIPFMVSLQWSPCGAKCQYQHICGATILNKNWILTAAHCLEDLELKSVEVVVGVHQIDIWTEGMTFHSPKRFVIHPNFNPNPNPNDRKSSVNDIALIEINEEILFESSMVNSASLPKPNSDPKGEWIIASGWGQMSTSDEAPAAVLQSVELPIDPNCKRVYKDLITDTVFCAGGTHKKDTCFGDSGGPAFQIDGNKPVIVGIISMGQQICGREGFPGIYTKVSKYVNWIYDTIN